jgi:integrase
MDQRRQIALRKQRRRCLHGQATTRASIQSSGRNSAAKGGSFPTWSMEQIKAAFRPPRRALILGLHAGQRRSDLIAMTWDAHDGRAIAVQQIKTGERLTIPVRRHLRVELERWKGAANVLPHPAVPILTTTAGPQSVGHVSLDVLCRRSAQDGPARWLKRSRLTQARRGQSRGGGM